MPPNNSHGYRELTQELTPQFHSLLFFLWTQPYHQHHDNNKQITSERFETFHTFSPLYHYHINKNQVPKQPPTSSCHPIN